MNQTKEIGLRTEKTMAKEKTAAVAWVKVLAIGLLTSLGANLLLQWAQNQLDLKLVYQFAAHWHTELFFLSTALLFVLYIWLTSLTGSKWLGSVLLSMSAVIASIITFHKMSTQQEPFYPNDLKMITNLPFLLKMLPTIQKWMLFLFLVLFTIGIRKWHHKQKTTTSYWPRIQKRILRLAGFILSSAILFYVGKFNQPANKVKAAYDTYAYWIPYSQEMNYYNNGFVGGFLYNLNVDPMHKPAGYSKEAMLEITKKYTQKAETMNQTRTGTLKETNVVYIMNESFSDPMRLNGIQANRDPIPYIRELEERSAWGYAHAQSIGGGTANSEFAALTGLSMEPLAPNISSPYTQIVEKMPTLPNAVQYLKKNGHHATAIHPFNTSMYKRKDVYPGLGFDEFIYDKTMQHAERVTPSSFISDESAYQEVLDVLKRSKEKDFIHLVTMQNHMPYANKYETTSFNVTGSGNDAEAEAYFEDLSTSQEALKQFVSELDKMEEEVLVVFWGDHLPGFYEQEVQNQNAVQAMYQTPLLIFSNKKNLNAEIGTLSPVYFFNEVLKLKNAPVSPFQALQSAMQENLPALEKRRYKEKNTWKTDRIELSEETNQLLHDYELVMYDLLSGDRTAKKNGFFETPIP